MKKSKRFLNAYIEEQLKLEVERLAIEHHCSMSSIVERAIAEFVHREKRKEVAIQGIDLLSRDTLQEQNNQSCSPMKDTADLDCYLLKQMVNVVPGRFDMGSNDGKPGEGPIRTVEITRGYWMGKTEVTQAQYETLTGSNPSHHKGANLPVEQVSWSDAVSFCELLTERERRAGRLPEGYVYRLPTEAEWEYAARGGSQSSNDIDEVAWYGANSGNTSHPVGMKAANELGLHDMSGNVLEWCHDWYQDSYAGLSTTDPAGPESGTARVGRGGSWYSSAAQCRVAYRDRFSTSRTNRGHGFRVALGPPL